MIPADRDPEIPTARVGPCDATLEVPFGTSLRMDALGRWLSAHVEGVFYRRVLDGTVVRHPSRRTLPEDVADVEAVHRTVAALAAGLHGRFSDPEARLLMTTGSERAELLRRLQRTATLPPSAYAEHAAAFASAYAEPIEILPPERYRDVVVLPATGCPNASCTFCAFYQGRPFRVLPPERFASHLAEVAALFGPTLPLRDGLFLGGAAGFSLSQRRVLEALVACVPVFGRLRRGVAGFWDPEHTARRTVSEWEALAAVGVGAVFVGLETGLAGLRAQVGKSADLAGLAAALEPARAGGVRVRLIVLAGLGGPELASDHRHASASFIAGLGLERADTVYVSPLRGALPPSALAAEERAMRDVIAAGTAARVVPYAVEAFRYFA